MVDGLVDMHLDLIKASGVELIMGEARLTGPRIVEVSLRDGGGTQVLTAERLFLNLGTRATIPDIPGLAGARPLTHVEALELDRLPGHLIVLGGGYFGLELAQAFRRFGAEVTLLEPGPQLASREDLDVASAILEMLRDEGIAVQLGATVRAVLGRSGEGVETPSGALALEGSDVLMAAGRTPNTGGIGLERAGVELDARGYVAVNDRLEPSASA